MAMNEKAYSLTSEQGQPQEKLDYSQILQSDSFQNLLSEKRRFIVPISIFFMAFFFALPIMTSYSKVLNQEAFGGINWAWIFAAGQFIMTWTLVTVYSSRAKKFDRMVDEIIADAKN